MPFFSVIMPVYNGEKFVARAIRSVLEQDFKDSELIVVDDGSTDDTPRIVQEFGGALRYFRKDNSGVSDTRNFGAREAQGQWLAFLDADDYYYPQRLSAYAKAIKSGGFDFLTGDFEYISGDGTFIRRSMQSSPLGRRLLEQAGADGLAVMEPPDFEGFIERHFGDTHTLTLPKETFLKLGGYPSGIPVCEDIHLLIRLCSMSKKVGVICDPLAVYVIHSASATRSDPERAQQYTVSTLLLLRELVKDSPRPVKRGLEKLIELARLDLSYTLLRSDKGWKAIKESFPLLQRPSLKNCKGFMSVVKSACTSAGR